MPNSSLHISFAKEAAAKLDNPIINNSMGSYFLGSTSPDIRNMTGWDRYKTHFFHLDTDFPGKGIDGLFKHHPNLAEMAKLGKETKAFVVGYMSHLVTDETWIVDVYRPFFGKSPALRDNPMKNVIDRALQFDMERVERTQLGQIDEVLAMLEESDREVRVGFIDSEELRRWREITYERIAQESSWEHFRGFARKGLPGHLKRNEQLLNSIVSSAPDLLAKAKSHVPPQVIAQFREKAISEFVKVAGEYLD